MINALAGGQAGNQRDLSTKTGMSLGMTNLVIKRLVKKGLLKVRQLNRRKVEYLLTSRGFSEKAKKSYRYMLKTINSVSLIKLRIQNVLQEKLKEGSAQFVLEGEGDFHDIVEMAVRGMKRPEVQLRRVRSVSKSDLKDAILLTAKKNSSIPAFVEEHINLVDAISSGNISSN
ncbi:MAG: hypothetical protein KCHDKBKB_01150 [Elusimicrobia bacterium]|nr:hypothetical protein [Elusimicrobiota bacterium]